MRSPSRLLPGGREIRRGGARRQGRSRPAGRGGDFSTEDATTEGAQEKEVPEDREEQLKKAQEESPAPVAAEEPASSGWWTGRSRRAPLFWKRPSRSPTRRKRPSPPVREPEDPESRAILQAARQAAGVLKEGQNGGPVYQGELRKVSLGPGPQPAAQRADHL